MADLQSRTKSIAQLTALANLGCKAERDGWQCSGARGRGNLDGKRGQARSPSFFWPDLYTSFPIVCVEAGSNRTAI